MPNLKLRLDTNLIRFLEILIFLLLLIIVYKFIINILNGIIIFNIDTITWMKETSGTLEVKNIKIEGLEPQIDKLRDGSLYIAGITAGARIVRNSSIPLAAKLGTTVGLGAASLIGYKIAQNSLKPNLHTGKTTATIDNINYNITAQHNNKSNLINTLTDQSSNSSDDQNIISSLDIEQLQLIFYLNLIIVYLLSMVIVFLLMKQISTLNLKFDFMLKSPYGDLIQNLIIKLLKIWEKTGYIWIYIILIVVLVNLSLSSWAIYVILSHIK